GEAPAAPVFIDGKKAVTLRGPTVAADFQKLVIDYIERRFGTGSAGRTAAEETGQAPHAAYLVANDGLLQAHFSGELVWLSDSVHRRSVCFEREPERAAAISISDLPGGHDHVRLFHHEEAGVRSR